MNTLMILLALGAAVGWVGSLLSRSQTVMGLDLSILAGMAGGLVGAYVMGPMMGSELVAGTDLDLMALFASFLGAVLGVASWSTLRGSRAR
jgi:uncharacterized membrane protein YeaQ/YmgE (transglycosylase-associated protein family)